MPSTPLPKKKKSTSSYIESPVIQALENLNMRAGEPPTSPSIGNKRICKPSIRAMAAKASVVSNPISNHLMWSSDKCAYSKYSKRQASKNVAAIATEDVHSIISLSNDKDDLPKVSQIYQPKVKKVPTSDDALDDTSTFVDTKAVYNSDDEDSLPALIESDASVDDEFDGVVSDNDVLSCKNLDNEGLALEATINDQEKVTSSDDGCENLMKDDVSSDSKKNDKRYESPADPDPYALSFADVDPELASEELDMEYVLAFLVSLYYTFNHLFIELMVPPIHLI
ncbi:hypothetical protein C0992_006986 [Termitomyces sp. T32_za158]|nr:hypothetical protein C0992_006986 [Termitomyces sp. T32_za158]